MDDEHGGLFNIQVSSEDEESKKNVQKAPRDLQSEADFERQRREWKPKIETGELWKGLQLPIDHPSKPQSQMILHAIEELYFFKRYDEAKNVAERALKGALSGDFRKIIEGYKGKCETKLKPVWT